MALTKHAALLSALIQTPRGHNASFHISQDHHSEPEYMIYLGEDHLANIEEFRGSRVLEEIELCGRIGPRNN